MSSRFLLTIAVLAAAGCSGESSAPAPRRAASLELVSGPPSTAVVGAAAGELTVRALDERGAPVSGIVVSFGVSAGGGSVSPAADSSDAAGIASTSVTIGTTIGRHEISANAAGAPPLRVHVDARGGPTRTLTLNQRVLRIPADDDGFGVTATMRDSVGNLTNDPITWTPRDPTLVRVTQTQNAVGVMNALRRPGETWVVARSGSAADSVRVAVQDSGSAPCDLVATPRALAVGGSLAVESVFTCVRADTPGAEFALVAHYNTSLNYVTSRVVVGGYGIIPRPSAAAARLALQSGRVLEREAAFETSLRTRESTALPSLVPGARDWRRRSRLAALQAAGVPSEPRVGDLVQLNVNAQDFCTNPSMIAARVAAVTQGTIVLADTANPVGGFTPEEYFSFAVTMDTLVHPVGVDAFGAPDDIDGNGRVAMLFTKAVNALTPRGFAGGVVLGFFYGRDLLPREGSASDCSGSNVGELFYLLAPDPEGRYSDPRSKSDVARTTMSTIAHEYQHLINASRRMYVTHAAQVNEEVWLNEGLSHIAEELVFYRVSGSAPRHNIDGSQLPLGTTTRELFDQYLLGNFRRFRLYALNPDANSPLAGDGLLQTRGATWSFLRYLADRAGASDGDFWRRLVDANRIGVPNLDAALAGSGLTTTAALADWSMAVFADDGVTTSNPAYQQPSWDYPSVIPATGISPSYPLATRELEDASPVNVVLQAGGTAYFMFGVGQRGETLLQTAGPGNVIPAGMRLTVLRIR